MCIVFFFCCYLMKMRQLTKQKRKQNRIQQEKRNCLS